MKQVICIDPKNFGLTRGNQYEANQDENNNNYYLIQNDNGLVRRYYHSLFEDVVVRSTFEEIVNSISISVEDGYTKITYVIDGETYAYNLQELDYNDTEISCGIKELSNINGLAHTVVNNIPTDERGNLRKAVLEKIYNFYLNQEGLVPLCGIILVSTNLNTTNIDDTVNILNELSSSFTDVYNPNSGNVIRLWTIETENTGDSTNDTVDEAYRRVRHFTE